MTDLLPLLPDFKLLEALPIELPVSFPKPTLYPITLRMANDLVAAHHRHSDRTTKNGGRWSVGVAFGNELVGCAIVGRPLARLLNDGVTAEVLRVCTVPHGPQNACSMLYSSCWRCWRSMGGIRLITYTLASEEGRSLHAAGFKRVATVKGAQWYREKRPNAVKPIYDLDKIRWEISRAQDTPAVHDETP